MNNNIAEWPIAPTFLSLRQGCTEDAANYNTDGIYYTDYIRGFLADLSHDKNIQNALSLFQFVPKDFLPHDPNAENPNEITKDPTKATVNLNDPLDPKITEILDRQGKKIIRIDSGTYVNNGRLCDAFRKCDSKHTSFCFMQDSIVGIFADEALNDLQPNTDQYRQSLEEIVAEFNQNRVEISKIKCDALQVFGKTKRVYVHYACPYSLFDEHFFPIYAQGHIIACLMFGQVGRENFDCEESFKEYMQEMKEKDSECPNRLLNIKYVNENQWEKKARAIIERIEIFEKRLEEKITHRNARFVNDAFEKIEFFFREEIRNINIREEDVFSQFSEVLNKAFTDIRKIFDQSEDDFIRMFALPISLNHDELVPIGWSGSDYETWKNAKIALKQLRGIEKTLEIEDKNERIKVQRRIILEAASKEIRDNFNKDLDFFLPGWLAGNEVAYIVWKRHNLELRNEQNKIYFKTYRTALKNFYSIAQECYSYIRGARMELLLETTIRESTHESAHYILPAIDVVEHHLVLLPEQMIRPECYEDYSSYIHYFERYKDEMLESLNQLREINSGASLIFASELKIRKREIEVTTLLIKLKKMLDRQAMDSHKNIYYSEFNAYVIADIDVTLFNHAVYNLLDNAIKYGHIGSKIHIKTDVDKDLNTLIVRVVSYGIGIPEDENSRVYNLFERGLEASKISRGTGLGMYIVQKVCEAHGGTVSHKSEELSKYNIPVLFNYKNKNGLAKNSSEVNKLEYGEELKRLSGTIEKEVVNDSSFVEYTNAFSSRINMATYRNTFIVTIPLH